MNRRSLLQGLAALPFTPPVLPAKSASAEESTRYADVGPIPPEEQQEFINKVRIRTKAEALMAFLIETEELHASLAEDKLVEDAEHLTLRHAVTLRTLLMLFDNQDSLFLSALYPGRNTAFLRDLAVQGEYVVGKELSPRPTRAKWSWAAMEDLRAFHGVDAKAELISAVSQQMVLEIQAEALMLDSQGKRPSKLIFSLPFQFEKDPTTVDTHKVIGHYRFE